MFCRRLSTVIASTAALSAMIGCASFVGAQGRPHGRPHFPGSQQPGGGPGEQQGGPGQNGQQNEPTSPGIPSPTLSQNTFVDDFGQFTTINNSAEAIQSNPFFEALGTNQRSCVTCHRPSEGWSITPASVQNLFAQTDGLDVSAGRRCKFP